MTARGKMRLIRYSLFSLAALAHLIVILYFRYTVTTQAQTAAPEASIIKLVDFQEYVPPPPPEQKKEEVVEVSEQPNSSESIIEIEEEVIEVKDAAPYREPDYLPQHKISQVPRIPTDEVLDRIEYPAMALRQKKEAVVYVELYIDQTGLVRKVVVLKDPGYGFAEAAVKALEGLQCTPAEANGTPVAVRFRYPIRFQLN
ncbi:MAG: energy transducer TonB [Spirochaetales bacterium]|nr:energy transducer TonB [Spirochaetales bacterium]